MELLGLLYAAVSAQGAKSGFFSRDAAALKLVFEQRQMRGHFAIQFGIGVAAAD
jgi:hypothetical protein